MKIFITSQKRKQAAKNETKTETEAEPNNLLRAYQRLVRPASPSPLPALLLPEPCLALPIVYIVFGNCSRCALLSFSQSQSHLTFLRDSATFRNWKFFFSIFSIFCRAFGAKTGLAGVAKSTWPKQTQPRFMGRLNTRLGFVVAPLISGHLLRERERGAGVAEAEAAKGAESQVAATNCQWRRKGGRAWQAPGFHSPYSTTQWKAVFIFVFFLFFLWFFLSCFPHLRCTFDICTGCRATFLRQPNPKLFTSFCFGFVATVCVCQCVCAL